MDPNGAAQELLKNQQFMEMLQRALKGEGKDGGDGMDALKNMPKEGDPNRDKWLANLQQKLQEEAMKEAKKNLEQVHSDENGQWMMVLPDPGFCIKTNLAGGTKVFINVCKHAKIAEPVPMEEGGEASDAEVRYRVPISCGPARPEKDKSGRPCKVYDVIVNPSTLQRCEEDHEFRRFVAALCMQWIKQKSEPTLNAEEFRNLNFKCKGTLEPQRIRLSTQAKPTNAMGDEIKLPTSDKAPTAPTAGAQSSRKMVEEIVPVKEAPPVAKVVEMAGEGSYDWSTHKRPMANPFFKENVPATYRVELFLPGISTIREVDVQISRRQLECYFVDDEEQRAPFLAATFPYPVSDDILEAKYVKKTSLLRLKCAVALPDETAGAKTAASKDAAVEEQEEAEALSKAEEEKWSIQREKQKRLDDAEAHIMQERRSYVENLSAVQSGDLPPAIREEVDNLPKEQLPSMLHRIDGKIKRGDSVDVLIDTLPEEVLLALSNYIREKLSLEPRKPSASPAPTAKEPVPAAAQPLQPTKTTRNGDEDLAPVQEFNYAKKAEKIFGVAFENRYLFALD